MMKKQGNQKKEMQRTEKEEKKEGRKEGRNYPLPGTLRQLENEQKLEHALAFPQKISGVYLETR